MTFLGAGFLSRLRAGTRAHPWRAGTAITVVIVVAGALYWVFGRSDDSSAAATATTRVVAASLGTISQSVSTTGTIAPADQADLNFGASGVVTAVKVALGDRVTTGR
jgi:membrane fusion protein, macrolide-specific efflux system